VEERFIQVRRTARYHVLGQLDAAPEIWIVIHGYGQLARYFLNNFKGLETGRCFIAPEGLSRFYLDAQHSRVGATWMTREDRLHEIEDHMSYLDDLVTEALKQAIPTATLSVLGFSQGVATASRWAARTRHRIHRLVLWAGTLPPELDREALAAWRGITVDAVLGDADEYAGPEQLEGQARKLMGACLMVRKHLFQGGHKLEAVTLARLIEGR